MGCPKCKGQIWVQNDITEINDHPIGVVKMNYCKCGVKMKAE